MKNKISTFTEPEIIPAPNGKTPKLLKVLENLSNPEKLIKSMLPLIGRFQIEAFKNFPYNGEDWDLAMFFKELGDDVPAQTTQNGIPLFDVLAEIKLGELKIMVENIQWKGEEAIGIFLKNPK